MQYSYPNDQLIDSPSYKNNKPEELELKQIDEADDISETLEDHELYAVVEKTHQRRSVPLSEFVDYVNNMHGNMDALFKKEFDVRIGVTTCMYLLLFCYLQSLCSDPNSQHDASRLLCNKEKNRFVNIVPCKLPLTSLYIYNFLKIPLFR